jgi:hypothetical protein
MRITKIAALAATAVMATAAFTAVTATSASADEPRVQCTTTQMVEVSETIATFTVWQPADAVSQWNTVWEHDFTVTVNPEDLTFTGTAVVQGVSSAGNVSNIENVTGSFGPNYDAVSFHTEFAPPVTGPYFEVVDLPTDATSQFDGTVVIAETDYPGLVEMKSEKPVVVVTTTQVPITVVTDYKNHGEYVSAEGGGSIPAHSACGMPIKANKIK